MSRASTDDVSSDEDLIPPLIHERRIDISSIDDEDHVDEDQTASNIHPKRTDISLDDDEDPEVIN